MLFKSRSLIKFIKYSIINKDYIYGCSQVMNNQFFTYKTIFVIHLYKSTNKFEFNFEDISLFEQNFMTNYKQIWLGIEFIIKDSSRFRTDNLLNCNN